MIWFTLFLIAMLLVCLYLDWNDPATDDED